MISKDLQTVTSFWSFWCIVLSLLCLGNGLFTKQSGVFTHSQTTNLRLFQTKRDCIQQFQMWQKLQKILQMGRKQCGKMRNCSLWAISPFPALFSKDMYCRLVKTRACLGKGEGTCKIRLSNVLWGKQNAGNQQFYAPASLDWGHIVFGLSDCRCICFVRKNFNIGHIFWLVRLRAFIFHMSICCDKTFLLVPSSRSSVEVKYQGHSFREKIWPLRGIGDLQTQLVPSRKCSLGF